MDCAASWSVLGANILWKTSLLNSEPTETLRRAKRLPRSLALTCIIIIALFIVLILFYIENGRGWDRYISNRIEGIELIILSVLDSVRGTICNSTIVNGEKETGFAFGWRGSHFGKIMLCSPSIHLYCSPSE